MQLKLSGKWQDLKIKDKQQKRERGKTVICKWIRSNFAHVGGLRQSASTQIRSSDQFDFIAKISSSMVCIIESLYVQN